MCSINVVVASALMHHLKIINTICWRLIVNSFCSAISPALKFLLWRICSLRRWFWELCYTVQTFAQWCNSGSSVAFLAKSRHSLCCLFVWPGGQSASACQGNTQPRALSGGNVLKPPLLEEFYLDSSQRELVWRWRAEPQDLPGVRSLCFTVGIDFCQHYLSMWILVLKFDTYFYYFFRADPFMSSALSHFCLALPWISSMLFLSFCITCSTG